ncbi:hypothetical protein HMPREF9177_01818 [Streptococcus intermedius F0413]|nr:hypothetical protein HMPREF9177_01818 [Streptococcus intermedius F0413]
MRPLYVLRYYYHDIGRSRTTFLRFYFFLLPFLLAYVIINRTGNSFDLEVYREKTTNLFIYSVDAISYLSSFTFIGTFFGSEKITNTSSYKGFSETVIKQIVEVTEKSLVFLHNVPHKVLVVLSILLVIAAIVFLIKQNILYANFAYIAYVLLGMVGTIYNYIGGMPLNNLYKDQAMRATAITSTRVLTIIYLVLNILFLVVAFFKMKRQQQDLTKEELQ